MARRMKVLRAVRDPKQKLYLMNAMADQTPVHFEDCYWLVIRVEGIQEYLSSESTFLFTFEKVIINGS